MTNKAMHASAACSGAALSQSQSQFHLLLPRWPIFKLGRQQSCTAELDFLPSVATARVEG